MAAPAKPKKVGIGARENIAELFREDRAEIFMDNNPRAGYEDDLENRVVYRRIESHVEELRIDEAWTKKRFRILFFIVLSAIGGEWNIFSYFDGPYLSMLLN